MRFDLVSRNAPYGGICRSVKPGDLLTESARNSYDALISLYFAYLDLMAHPTRDPYNAQSFEKLIEYYTKFKELGVDCEIIAYDSRPLDDAFGRQVQLLGIDVVCDLAESLLEDPDRMNVAVKERLNRFGLCRDVGDAEIVSKHSDCGDNVWTPCWVYRINMDDPSEK